MSIQFNNPQELIEAYSNGFRGSYCDPVHYEKFVSGLRIKSFSETGLAQSGKGKLSLPFKFVEKLSAVKPYEERQELGDCVSHGSRNAIDISRAVQSALKHIEAFITVGCTEAIYGSRGYGGDNGMSCSQAAEFLHNIGGVLLRKNYEGIADLSRYNSKFAYAWGGSGVPRNLIELAKQHGADNVTPVTTLEQARDAIANGYGVAVCSNQGFAAQRDSKGYARAEGSWRHCFLPGTFISGPNGSFIEFMQKNDLVYTHTGDIQRVTEKMERDYDGDVITIKVQNCPNFTVTQDHPFLVVRKISRKIMIPAAFVGWYEKKQKTSLKNKEFLWVKASEVEKDDLMVCPHLQLEETSVIPEIEYTPRNKKEIILKNSADLCWLFGVYIAKGNFISNHKICFTLNLSEMWIAEKLQQIVKKNFGLKTYIYTKHNCIRVAVYSSVLAKNFHKWFGNLAHNKQIPEFLFSWNLRNLIEGIFAEDGTWVKGTSKAINSTSRKLVSQIYHLLITLGENPSIHKTKKQGYLGSKGGWRVDWSENSKGYKGKNEYEMYYLPVKSVEKQSYSGKVYNLEVEKDHTYIANGIVTHNCMAWIGFDDRNGAMSPIDCNSWGHWISGPKPDYGIPDGAFLIHPETAESMIRAGGSFAYSSVRGFPPVKLPDYGTSAYL